MQNRSTFLKRYTWFLELDEYLKICSTEIFYRKLTKFLGIWCTLNWLIFYLRSLLSFVFLIFCFFVCFRISYLIAVVGPTTKFHITMLIIKWEPRDVYLACALEDSRGHVQTTAVMFDYYICVVRAIESLIRTN